MFRRGRKDSDLRNVREHVHSDYKSGAINHSATTPRSRGERLKAAPLFCFGGLLVAREYGIDTRRASPLPERSTLRNI
jgi:hypothetical protein